MHSSKQSISTFLHPDALERIQKRNQQLMVLPTGAVDLEQSPSSMLSLILSQPHRPQNWFSTSKTVCFSELVIATYVLLAASWLIIWYQHSLWPSFSIHLTACLPCLTWQLASPTVLVRNFKLLFALTRLWVGWVYILIWFYQLSISYSLNCWLSLRSLSNLFWYIRLACHHHIYLRLHFFVMHSTQQYNGISTFVDHTALQ